MPRAKMPPRLRSITLPDAAATDRIATRFAGQLGAGDTILLCGEIGAGKTHFARALIRATQVAAGEAPEDVPSPTFTLVQVYTAGATEIWHADLYRLTGADEVLELGLDAAFDAALVLVEWPDRLGGLAPPGALWLEFVPVADGEARTLLLAGDPVRWAARLDAITEAADA